MTGPAAVYGEALYQLARDEGLEQTILPQLEALEESFQQEPEFLRLLTLPDLPKAQRCEILDTCFRDRVHPYLLNVMKLLTEKGAARHFAGCCAAFRDCFDRDHGILRVTAVTAVALSEEQTQRLTDTLSRQTGKRIALRSRIDPRCLGGVRLDYDGQRLEDTVSGRLSRIRELLMQE